MERLVRYSDFCIDSALLKAPPPRTNPDAVNLKSQSIELRVASSGCMV